ncbi:hypothetical protein CCHR01_01567 [Colletotrichum chrysophilum]|uniref:Uncharacterized protein n=1 Tax=Colletotrichum chrysophilum TaxID=1836956 RepID=A0AAD9AYZ6_9PEZI|nr:hypothetical protein CCHR01_01567 [Colletotrichum chrysophilum]
MAEADRMPTGSLRCQSPHHVVAKNSRIPPVFVSLCPGKDLLAGPVFANDLMRLSIRPRQNARRGSVPEWKMRIRTLPSGPSHLETSLQPRNAGRADPTLNLAPPVRANQTRPVGLVALPASIVCIESSQKIFTSNQVYRCQACARQVKPGNGSLKRSSRRSSTCLTSHSFSNAHAASFAQTWRFLQETWHANRGPARACLLVASTDPMPHGSILQHWREFHIQKSSRVLLAIRKQVLAVVAISTNA